MKERLEAIRKNAQLAIEQAKDVNLLEQVRVQFLGKNQELASLLK